MEIPDDFLCLFSAEVKERRGEYVVEIPTSQVTLGGIADGEVYRVAMLPAATDSGADMPGERRVPEPPVSEGEIREVEIEDIGEQGDGIARIDRGYIVFVPETGVGDRVTVEITDVRESFAFGEAIEGPY